MVKIPIHGQNIADVMHEVRESVGSGDGYNWWVDTLSPSDPHLIMDENRVDTGFISYFLLKYT